MRQPESVEDEAAGKLSRKHVHNTDDNDQQNSCESWNRDVLKSLLAQGHPG